MFILHVSADIFGAKKNIELGFQLTPTLIELAKRINDAYTVERKLGRVPGHKVEPFCVQRMDVYDDVKKRWVRLVSPTQLHEWAQLFAVSADEARNLSRLDESALPSATRLAARLPKNSKKWSETGVPAVPEWVYHRDTNSKVAAVFQELDVAEKGYVTQDDFLRVFDANYMGLGRSSIYDLFHGGDYDNDGRITWPEWIPFFEEHPKLMQSMYYRTRQYWSDVGRRKESSEVTELLDFHRMKAERAHGEYRSARQEVDELEQYINQRKSAHREATDVEIEQEQIIIEQQAKLRQMNSALKRQEHALNQKRTDFTSRHGREPGSPRRHNGYT